MGDNRAMTATFVYDGDCGFCTTCARFAQRWVPSAAAIVPWQRTDLPALGLTAEQCEAAVQWVTPATVGAPLAGPDAIAALLRSSHAGWRPVGWLLGSRGVRLLAWPAYRWVARNRHRLPGGTAACAMPSPGAAGKPPAASRPELGDPAA